MYIVVVVSFYERWKQTEAMHAEMLQFSLDDDQWQQDWAVILSIASQPGQCVGAALTLRYTNRPDEPSAVMSAWPDCLSGWRV